MPDQTKQLTIHNAVPVGPRKRYVTMRYKGQEDSTILTLQVIDKLRELGWQVRYADS